MLGTTALVGAAAAGGKASDAACTLVIEPDQGLAPVYALIAVGLIGVLGTMSGQLQAAFQAVSNGLAAAA